MQNTDFMKYFQGSGPPLAHKVLPETHRGEQWKQWPSTQDEYIDLLNFNMYRITAIIKKFFERNMSRTIVK